MRYLRSRPPTRRGDRSHRRWLGAFLFLILILPAVARPDGDAPLLKDALEAIARTGVRLIYSSEIVPPDLRTRRPLQGGTVAEQLRSLLAPLNLEAQPLPGGYVIVAGRRAFAALNLTVLTVGEPPGEPVFGAVVSIPRVARRARTDRLGRVALTDLPPATYDVEIRADGFRNATQTIRIDSVDGNPPLDIRLERERTALDQIIVETSRYDVAATSGIPVARDALAGDPVTSNDVARALQLLPGSAVAGYTARTHVRGGRDDETLFRYDGLTLNDPYHLEAVQSLFSAIDPATVESVTSWTGIAPIQFGGRIGAVVDIEPRRIISPTLEITASQQAAGVLLGAPFADGRGSVFAAARFGNAASPVGWIDQELGRPSFNDLVVRATWAFGPSTNLAAGIIGIDDRRAAFAAGDARARELSGRELYSWLRLTHVFAGNVRSETLVSTQDSHDYLRGHVHQAEMAVGFLKEHDRQSTYTVREEVTISPAQRWSARIGAERTEANVNDQLASFVRFDSPFVPALQPRAFARQDTDVSVRAVTSAVYGGLRWQATDTTVADIGLRRDSRRFGSLASDSQWNLRVNVRQRVSDSTTLRLGWGQASQADVLDPTSVADGVVQPASARRLMQSNLSLEHLLRNGWLLRAEAYDKSEGSPLATYENAFSQFTLLPELGVDRQLVQTQRSRMRGLEVRLETDRSRPLSGCVSYAWSRAEDLIAGQWTPRSWDQPDAVQLGGLWQHGPWHVAGFLSWHSGWPYTPLLASSMTWSDRTADALALAPRNSARLPNFMSLDLRLSWEHRLGLGVFQAFVALYDVSDSNATCCRNYTVVSEQGGSYRLVETRVPWLTFTPIFGFRWTL